MKSFAELLDKVDAFHDLNVDFCDFEGEGLPFDH